RNKLALFVCQKSAARLTRPNQWLFGSPSKPYSSLTSANSPLPLLRQILDRPKGREAFQSQPAPTKISRWPSPSKSKMFAHQGRSGEPVSWLGERTYLPPSIL